MIGKSLLLHRLIREERAKGNFAVRIDAAFLRLLLPGAVPEPASGPEPEPLLLEPAIAAVERKLILRALGAANDNKARAARLLGVSERTLWYKLKRYGL